MINCTQVSVTSLYNTYGSTKKFAISKYSQLYQKATISKKPLLKIKKKIVSSSNLFSKIKRERKDLEVWEFYAHILWSYQEKKKDHLPVCYILDRKIYMKTNKHFWKANTLSEQNQAITPPPPQLLHQLQIMIGLFAQVSNFFFFF